jgi:hypothetical protein
LILDELGFDENFTHKVREIIGTHHDHPDHPTLAFKILYDSDKLAMLSPEEFPYYDSIPNFNWEKIIDLIYSEKIRNLAKELLNKIRPTSD